MPAVYTFIQAEQQALIAQEQSEKQRLGDLLAERVANFSPDVLVQRAAGSIALGIDMPKITGQFALSSEAKESVVQSAIRRELIGRLCATRPEDVASSVTAIGLYAPKDPKHRDRLLTELVSEAKKHSDSLPAFVNAFAAVGHGDADEGQFDARKVAVLRKALRRTDDDSASHIIDALARPLGYQVKHEPGLLRVAGSHVGRQTLRKVPAAAATAAILGGAMAVPAQAAETTPPKPEVTQSATVADASIIDGQSDQMVIAVSSDTTKPKITPENTPVLNSNVVTPRADSAASPVIVTSQPTVEHAKITPQKFNPDSVVLVSPDENQPAGTAPSDVTPPGITPTDLQPPQLVDNLIGNGKSVFASPPSPQTSTVDSSNLQADSMPAPGASIDATQMPNQQPDQQAITNGGDTSSIAQGDGGLQVGSPEQTTIPSDDTPSNSEVPAEQPDQIASDSGQSTAQEQNLSTADELTLRTAMAQQLLNTVDIALQANDGKGSISVLNGGLPLPKDASDNMPDALKNSLDILRTDLRATLDGKTENISFGSQAWQDKILEPNTLTQFSDQIRQSIMEVDSAAQALVVAGDSEKADTLRAVASYEIIIQYLSENPNLAETFAPQPVQHKPAPPTPSSNKSNQPESSNTSKNPNNHYANYTLTSAQMDVINQVARANGFSSKQKQTFILAVEDFVRLAYKYQVSPSAGLGMMALESGMFQHSSNNNFFGIKASASAPSSVQKTQEVINGKLTNTTARFASFTSVEAGIEYFVGHVMHLPWYDDARAHFNNPKLFLDGVQNQTDAQGSITIPHKLAYAAVDRDKNLDPNTYRKRVENVIDILRLRELIPAEFFSTSRQLKTVEKPMGLFKGAQLVHGMIYQAQVDSAVKDIPYSWPGDTGRHTIGTSACLPYTEANIITNFGVTLKGTDSAKWNQKNGFRIPNHGTVDASWFAFAKKYHLGIARAALTPEYFKKVLSLNTDPAHPVVQIAVSGQDNNPNTPATSAGHWFDIVGVNKDGTFRVLDSNSKSKTKKHGFTFRQLDDSGLRVGYVLTQDPSIAKKL